MSSLKRCVNCWRLVRQEPQVIDHLRMVKLNSIIDRSHKLLDAVLGIDGESWDDFVGIAVGAIRATVNRSTGFTPNRMMLGREVMIAIGFDVRE